MRYFMQRVAQNGLAMGNAQAQTSDQMANAQRFADQQSNLQSI